MKLVAFLEKHNVPYERHTHSPTYTAQDLASVEHVSGYMVAKPVVVKAGNTFAMCVITAPQHVDLNAAAGALQERELRLATEEEMSELFDDCELGAEPPLGVMFGLKTVMDEQLRQDEFITLQAGSHTEAVKIRRADWEQLCEPVVADITCTRGTSG